MADLVSCFFSALSALSARKKILANMRGADGLQCKDHSAASRNPIFTTKGTKITKKNRAICHIQYFVSFVLFVVKGLCQKQMRVTPYSAQEVGRLFCT
jgi:hypothetical protein